MTDKNTNTHQPQPLQAKDTLLTHIRVSVIAVLTTAVLLCGVYPLLVWGLAEVLFHHQAHGSLVTDSSGKVIGSELICQGFSAPQYFHPRLSANSYDPTNTGGTNLGPTSKKLINGTTKPATMPATQPGGKPIDIVVADFNGVKLNVLKYCAENKIPFTLLRQERDGDGKITKETPVDAAEFRIAGGDWDTGRLVNAFNDDVALTVKPQMPIPADAVTWSGSGLDPHISPDNARLQIARVAEARNARPTDIGQLVQENTDGRSLGILGDSGVNVMTLNMALDKKFPVPAAPPATAPATAP